MAARDILQAAGGATGKLYVDDVFSTYLYDGNGATQTINNGIDLAGNGGMVWFKLRNAGTQPHCLFDTTRGVSSYLNSASTSGQQALSNGIVSFNNNGLTLGSGALNLSGDIGVSWTFRKAPKFFDVVTYTGNGTTQNIAHSLGQTPGMVIVKVTSAADGWYVWHRSLTGGEYLRLNTSGAQSTIGTVTIFGNNTSNVDPTSSVFTVGSAINQSSTTYVAYLFAHDTSTDGMVQCGSFTTDTSGNATVNLGWEPQFLLVKATSTTNGWAILDSTRGLVSGANDAYLIANTTAAESLGNNGSPRPDGFDVVSVTSSTNIYLAIRIPNKPPTSGTQVFQPVTYTGTNTDNRLVNTGIKTDMAWFRMRTGSGTGYEGFVVGDRLRGQGWLKTAATQAETTTADGLDQQIVSTTEYGTAFSSMTGVFVGNNTGAAATNTNINANTTANNHIVEAFKRAPRFMDIVCYTGTGAARTVNHQLGVAPELMIIKRRSTGDSGIVYAATEGPTKYGYLDASSAFAVSSGFWNDTLPTSSAFTVGTLNSVNGSGSTYVAYLFATLPGISKVGSYTGNGTSQTIDCGFTTGARFVMIKRTDAANDWFLFDTARGISAAGDALLYPSATFNETSQDVLDTSSIGFIVNQVASYEANVSGGTYIYLAIA